MILFELRNSKFQIPNSFCGVAKLVRHRTVNAAMRRFESFRHSQVIADFQLPNADLSALDDLNTPQIPIGNWQSEIGNVIDPELE